MDEIWERAVETALDGQTDLSSVRTLTLDGAVKCFHGRLPPPFRFEKFQNLQHLSLANIGLSSLDHFPRLKNLQKLILSDNRIAGGLELLVEAGLELLRDLDLSNNRIQDINDLKPLRELKLVSLDLYECPVTRVKDYRSRVFGLIKSLKYLDKMDAEENERPESEDDEDEEDDPGSGEIDGEDRSYRMSNGHSAGGEGVIDVDEDEESDADGEEREMLQGSGGWNPASLNHYSNVFGVVPTGDREEEEEGEDEDDNDLVEEIDEEKDEDEVYEIDDSDDEEDGVEDDEDDEDSEDEEEVDNDEGDFGELESTGRLVSTEGEIDGHEQGEEDGEEEDDGETGEEGQCVEEDGVFEEEEDAEEEDDDYAGYLLQPVRQAEENVGGSDIDLGNDSDPEMEEDVEYEDEDEDEDGDEDDAVQVQPPSSSHKRKRDEDDSEEEDDDVGYAKSSKHR